MNRELIIVAQVLEDRLTPPAVTELETQKAVRRALEDEGFDVGKVVVRCRELPA